ncbi:unnamed protein product [Paramecium primaurelia]|uniref:Uncharacterized protein n=1 Tax=Paramecium primaurelia TaxID=5886 RepID=A0A8S1L0F9_PARPR|nr:unnamed protein product [Paramecium primaurelia]
MKNQVTKSVSHSAIPKPEKSQTHKTPEKHGIPRNVNYYSHFLAEPYITEKDIEFVLQLRNMDNTEMTSKLARIPNQVFTRGDQKIESQKVKHLSRDINYTENSSQILHLIKGRIGPTPHLSQAEFETGLRSYARTDKSLVEKERNWTTVPKTKRKDIFPEFLPNYKEEMQKRKSLSITGNKLAKLTYSAFDPDTHYPPYSMKFNEKNIQHVRHMFVPGVKMSTVQWQEGLRPLVQIKRQKKEKEKK